jgi:TonB family protein
MKKIDKETFARTSQTLVQRSHKNTNDECILCSSLSVKTIVLFFLMHLCFIALFAFVFKVKGNSISLVKQDLDPLMVEMISLEPKLQNQLVNKEKQVPIKEKQIPIKTNETIKSKSFVEQPKTKILLAKNKYEVVAPESSSIKSKPALSDSVLTSSDNNQSHSVTEQQPATTFISPRFDAGYLNNPAPSYPVLSRQEREQGKVILRVFVEVSGLAGRVELYKSSGFERLDRSAQKAVTRWKFVPARAGGEAVGAWVLVPLLFNLNLT